MYARILRKWSLKTKRMSIKRWLTVVVVVTMLLLIICAPVTVAAPALLTANVAAAALTNADYNSNNNRLPLQQPTSTTTTSYHTKQLQKIESSAAESLSAASTFKNVFKQSTASVTSAKIPPNVGSVIEESFYIPVASQEYEEADSYRTNNRAAIRNWQDVANNNRLINELSSSSSNSNSNSNNNNNNNIDNINSSSSSSSSRSSNSKIFNSISRLSSINNRHQQQQPQEQQQQKLKGNEQKQPPPLPQQHLGTAHTDSLVYSYYYKTPISAPVLDRIKPQQLQHQQQQQQQTTVANENVNDVDDNEQLEEDEEDDDDDVEGDEAADDTDGEEELEELGEYENEMENTPNEKDSATVYKQKVPNVKNSQIFNILNNAYGYNKQKEQQQMQQQQMQQQQIDVNSHTMEQQQQQQLIAVTVVPIYVRSIKARRHIQEHQQHQQQSYVASQNYHSPVRETTTSPSIHSTSVTRSALALSLSSSTAIVNKFSNITATLPEHSTPVPYRYLIKSLVLTPSLENITNLPQDKRQELWDEHEKRRLKMQYQPPRSRRDSRIFGQMQNVAGGNAQQQFQRLQQQPTNLSNNNINKQQQQQYVEQPHHNHNSQQHQHNHHHHHHHNQQRQHSHQHQNQRQRKHARRYCSARDPAQLAFEAPTVFEGKIISMTPNRRANFSATVEVKNTFKHQFGYRLQKYVRLQFAYRNSSGECDIYREQLRPRGLVRGDQLEQGRVYLMFVQQIDLGNFTMLGQPIRKTRRVVEAVKNAVSENYAQLASIRSLTANKRVVEIGKELRIICRVFGSPPPKVTWFKNDKSINRNREIYQFVHYKRRSELIIRSFNSTDAGRYECRTKNKANRNVEHRIIVITAYKVPRYETSLTGGTGNNCPDDASEFCFNGGTCQFFPQIGSFSCICVEGFTGERCDSKEANNMPPSTYSNEQECGEKKFLGSFYC